MRKAKNIIEPIDMSIKDMSMAMLGMKQKIENDEIKEAYRIKEEIRKINDLELLIAEKKLKLEQVKQEIINSKMKEDNITYEEAEAFINKILKDNE